MQITATQTSTPQTNRSSGETRAAPTPMVVGSGTIEAVTTSAPVETANAVEATTKAPPPSQVQEAVKAINDTMSAMSRNIEFSYDADINRMIVTVVDQDTKEVIQQMPTKDALDIARALDKVQGLLIRQKA